jgi:hypothetical protein
MSAWLSSCKVSTNCALGRRWRGCALLRQSFISDHVCSALLPFGPWTVICNHLPSLTPWFNAKTVAGSISGFCNESTHPLHWYYKHRISSCLSWLEEDKWSIEQYFWRRWVPSLMNPQGFNLLLLYQCISIFFVRTCYSQQETSWELCKFTD